MKHLKSSSRDLRELFEQSISVRYIAEPLLSFDAELPAKSVQAILKDLDYDVVGVRHRGLVTGYVHRDGLGNGLLGESFQPFSPAQLMPEGAPLIQVFEALRESPQVFILTLGQVGGIVTRGDLQKAPVRMWLFGLISLVEMQLLRIIRHCYPLGTWKQLVPPNRLSMAEQVLTKRQQRNEAIDLEDCLQLGDKREIILKNGIWQAAGLRSRKEGERVFKDLEKLRDNLAHAQDIITGHWPEVVDLAKRAEEILISCEEADLSVFEQVNQPDSNTLPVNHIWKE